MTDNFYRWLKELIKSGNVHPFYISAPWRKARAEALKYYHWECQHCKNLKTPSVLTPATLVHHAKPLKRYPQYALSLFIYDKKTGKMIPQLIPLCGDCHAECHKPADKTAEKKQQSAIEANERYPERW